MVLEVEKEDLKKALITNYKYSDFWSRVFESEYELNYFIKNTEDKTFHETALELINLLYKKSPFFISPDNLRINWLDFEIKDENKEIRYYQSSATSGENANISIWTLKDLEISVNFLAEKLPKIYNLLSKNIPKVGIIVGPYGWYQEENTNLFWRLGIKRVYFVGIETLGLKKQLVENRERALERIYPTMKRLLQYISNDNRDLAIRYPPIMYDIFKPIRDRIKVFITSGLEITSNLLDKLQMEFSNSQIIPLYGDSMFGDAIGLRKNDNIIYYPPPKVHILCVKKRNNNYELCEYGERGEKALIRIGDAALYVFVDEKEIIGREKPLYEFGIERDGFSNPTRVISSNSKTEKM